MAENDKDARGLSFSGDLRTQVMILLAGIGSFATFLPLLLNNLNANLGISIKWGYFIFMFLYFFLVPLILFVACLNIKGTIQLSGLLRPLPPRLSKTMADQQSMPDRVALCFLAVSGVLVIFFPYLPFDCSNRSLAKLFFAIVCLLLLLAFAGMAWLKYRDFRFSYPASLPAALKEQKWLLPMVIRLEYLIISLLGLAVAVLFYCKILHPVEAVCTEGRTVFDQYNRDERIRKELLPQLDQYCSIASRAELGRRNRVLRLDSLNALERFDTLVAHYNQEKYYSGIIGRGYDSSVLEDLSRRLVLAKPGADSLRSLMKEAFFGQMQPMNEVLAYKTGISIEKMVNQSKSVVKKLDSLLDLSPDSLYISGLQAEAIVAPGREFARAHNEKTKLEWTSLIRNIQFHGMIWLFVLLFYCFTMLYCIRLELLRFDVLLRDPEVCNQLPGNQQWRLRQHMMNITGEEASEEARAQLFQKGWLYKNICLVIILLMVPFFRNIKDVNLAQPFLQTFTLPALLQIQTHSLPDYSMQPSGKWSDGHQVDSPRKDTVLIDGMAAGRQIQALERINRTIDSLISSSRECCAQKSHDSTNYFLLKRIDASIASIALNCSLRAPSDSAVLEGILQELKRHTGALYKIDSILNVANRKFTQIETNTRKIIPNRNDRDSLSIPGGILDLENESQHQINILYEAPAFYCRHLTESLRSCKAGFCIQHCPAATCPY